MSIARELFGWGQTNVNRRVIARAGASPESSSPTSEREKILFSVRSGFVRTAHGLIPRNFKERCGMEPHATRSKTFGLQWRKC